MGEIGSRDQFGCTFPFVAKVDCDANDMDNDDDNDDDDDGKVHKYMNHRTAMLATKMWSKEYFFKSPCSYFTITITTSNSRKGSGNIII